MQLTHHLIGWLLGFSLTVVAVPTSCLALTVQEVPNPRQSNSGWVTDMADILSPTTEARLNQIVSELEVKNGAEFAIVTVPQTNPDSTPKEFATGLFNTWKIGKKDRDNGLLLLISRGDRRIEIETGYGLEGVLPDAKVGQIIDRDMKPKFKQGDFDRGTLAGIQALVAAVDREISNPVKQPTSLPLTTEPLEHSKTSDSWIKLILGCGGASISIILAALYLRQQERSKDHKSQRDQPARSVSVSLTNPPTSIHHYQRRSDRQSHSYPRNIDRSHSSSRYSDNSSNRASDNSSSNSYDSGSSSSSWASDSSSSSSYDSGSSSSYSESSNSYSSSDFGGGSSGGGGAGSDF